TPLCHLLKTTYISHLCCHSAKLKSDEESRLSARPFVALLRIMTCSPSSQERRLVPGFTMTDCKTASRYSTEYLSSPRATDLRAPKGCCPIPASSYPSGDNPMHTSTSWSRSR